MTSSFSLRTFLVTQQLILGPDYSISVMSLMFCSKSSSPLRKVSSILNLVLDELWELTESVFSRRVLVLTSGNFLVCILGPVVSMR